MLSVLEVQMVGRLYMSPQMHELRYWEQMIAISTQKHEDAVN